jgi:N-acetylneuraminic acid mutarotase
MFSRISKLFMACIVLVVISGIQQVSADEMETGTWTQKADMPTARYIAGSAVVDGKIYVIGGAPVYQGITAVVEEYDPAADTWTRRADMPTARQGLGAAAVDGIIISAIAVVNGIIYVIGGYGDDNEALSVVEAYDPATDMWTRKADMPTARYYSAACTVDGRIYVFGGKTDPEVSVGSSTVEVYDPATDTWTQASDMPGARREHSASVVAGKMYIIGGDRVPGTPTPLIVDVYDPAPDTWTTATRIPYPKWFHTAAVVDGKIYTFGGKPGPAPPDPVLSTVYEFDPGLPVVISSVRPGGKLLETWGRIKKVR